MSKKVYMRWIYCILVTLILVAADQFTKYLAVEYLMDSEPFVIIEGIFELLYVENKGAAYGALSGRIGLFVILTAIIIPVLIFEIYRINQLIDLFKEKVNVKMYRVLQMDLFLLIAGAIGNLIDRLVNGYVVDFFYFKLIDFPVFNVADCYITVAAVVLMIICIFFLNSDEVDYLLESKKKWIKRETEATKR